MSKSKPADARGLENRYIVSRSDGRDLPGGDRQDALLFVMDYRYDPTAWVAVASYAVCCEPHRPALARDLARNLLVVLPSILGDARRRAELDGCFPSGKWEDGSPVHQALIRLSCQPGGPLLSVI